MSDEPKPMSLGQVAFLAWWHADVRWTGWRPSWDHLPYLEAVSWEAAAKAVLEAADAANPFALPRPTTAASDDPLAPETRLRSQQAMTDDDRLARLTELARRVYGEDLADRITPIEVEPGHYVILHGRWKQLMRIDHPRALDALEAALLVLADEPTPYRGTGGLGGPEALRLSRGYERALRKYAELRARLERLTREWERRSEGEFGLAAERAIQSCVAELRALLEEKP